MSLFEIIQYEVQVFQDGHWHVRARYPRSDRDHAFTEARRIDLNESHPTRVVRDIYDPETGRNQEIAIFVSDRAKGASRAANTPTETRAMNRSRSSHRSTAPSRHTDRPTPLAFRATMALGVGLVTATLITAIMSWALAPQHESFASVLARTPSPGSAMTVFVAVMLFAVFTMLRGPLGISRLARTLGAYLSSPSMAAPVGAAASRPMPMRKITPMRPPAVSVTPEDQMLSLSQVMLARLFNDAAPANTVKAVDDPLGRRGLALYLAGAASELASLLEMPAPADLLTKISPAALQTAVTEALGEIRALSGADAALLAAGRAGLQKYVSAADERPSMANALVAWHKAIRAEREETPLLLQERPARAS